MKFYYSIFVEAKGLLGLIKQCSGANSLILNYFLVFNYYTSN